MTKLLVIAKAPVPGRVKTRLCPPCTLEESADIARAALADTLRAVSEFDGVERVLVLDGSPDKWIPPGFRVIHQRGTGLAERLDAAFEDGGLPALLIGMDTPQVSSGYLSRALEALNRPGVDAVLGDAEDGGWWIAGFRRRVSNAFAGVPMSTARTAFRQRLRFRRLGLNVAPAPRLRDVDTFADALVVARAIPDSAFAKAVSTVARRLADERRTEVATA